MGYLMDCYKANHGRRRKHQWTEAPLTEADYRISLPHTAVTVTFPVECCRGGGDD